MSGNLPPKGLTRVTAIEVDGNGIGAVALSLEGGVVRVDAIQHVETERLVEVVEKVRHPIFMDVPRGTFPEPALLAARLKDVFDQPVFRNPAVVVLGGEKSEVTVLTGKSGAVARAERIGKMLHGALPINPLVYPCLFCFREEDQGNGLSSTVMIRIQMMELLPLSMLVGKYAPSLVGSIASQTAASAVLDLLRRHNGDGSVPVMLCQMGKLRTLFTTARPDGSFAHNAIPVGLARDDMHYFKSISPDTTQLNRMKLALGNLFLPPEVTPSPLFSGWASSPQIDCTRFAMQVSHFAGRCLGISDPTAGSDHEGIFYIGGRASRIVGLRQFIEMKLGLPLRRVDRRPVPGIELSDKVKWGDVADNLLSVGAGIHVLRPSRDSVGLIGTSYVPPPMQGERCTVSEIENHKLYVFERRPDLL